MTRGVLAIDSGGTKCDALLVDEDGTALGWGRCGYPDPCSGTGWSGSGRSPQSVQSAVKTALGGRAFDELHACASARWLSGNGLAVPIGEVVPYSIHEPDGPMALAGVSCGVVALAGTGAFVHAKTRDGRTCHLDGLGPDLGDYGSAYEIGVMAVRRAARAGWHSRHQTSLAEPIFKACVPEAPDTRGHRLIGYLQAHRDRAEIASLARIVDEEANKGDRVAREILRQSAAGLAETAFDVIDRLGIRDEEYALIGTGSVATHSRIFWQHFCRRVKAFAPRMKPTISRLPPAVGIALVILERMGAPAEARERLLETVGAVIGGK